MEKGARGWVNAEAPKGHRVRCLDCGPPEAPPAHVDPVAGSSALRLDGRHRGDNYLKGAQGEYLMGTYLAAELAPGARVLTDRKVPGDSPANVDHLVVATSGVWVIDSKKWTGEIDARNTFSDGFPILVASTASLAELNRRLAAAGHAAVGMNRFRPNLVIDGLADAHGEDFIDTLIIDSPDGDIVLKLVKPCSRCTIPDVDPASAEQGHAIADTMAAYRAEPRLNGALTFGQNAVIVSGFEHRLRVGARVRAALAFD